MKSLQHGAEGNKDSYPVTGIKFCHVTAHSNLVLFYCYAGLIFQPACVNGLKLSLG